MMITMMMVIMMVMMMMVMVMVVVVVGVTLSFGVTASVHTPRTICATQWALSPRCRPSCSGARAATCPAVMAPNACSNLAPSLPPRPRILLSGMS